MKIAIIGNMNNNGFSLMRYFNYLGIETHLFLFQNDGKGPFEHFKVENDTWELEKWEKYIHRMNISNGYRGIIGYPEKLQFPIYSNYLKKLFANFDILIGSGIAPALLYKAGLTLDVFFPYSIGIEYVSNIPTLNRLNSSNIFIRKLCEITRNLQINGIKKSRCCINFDLGFTEQIFKELNCKTKKLSVPIVYNKEKINLLEVREDIKDVVSKINKYDLKVLSHCRHLWFRKENFSEEEWYLNTKNNDWLINGFSRVIKEINNNSLLILFEYGDDVEKTKDLIKELQIENNVLWLSTMSRKEIMYILNYIDIGVGEFYNIPKTVWGGTGWEIMASGKPMLQSFRFNKGEFKEITGYDEPKLLNVLKEEDIFTHLANFFEKKEEYVKLGKDLKDWFDKFNGLNLAKQWINILEKL
ncbi:glycosyltransferase [Aliarcobacter cryaerophilus]|uniref:hypothetical protein n=1 Tax=Aliarcobacter cryaerophilus TaxID=28198 RepID=UPI003BB019A9